MRTIVVALLLTANAAAAEPIRVHVYHTNDIHGWIMDRPMKEKPDVRVGGAPAMAALIAKDATPKLLLDAGDWFQGTPEGGLTKGEAVADIFNAMGYDAVAVGNHEFDMGPEVLLPLVAKITVPVLSANIYDDKTGKRVPWTTPWIIKEVGGVKFGIFGLTTTGMKRLAFPKNIAGLRFRREAEEARDAVAALKKAGAEVIVAVTHVGFEIEGKPKFEGDQTIAREVPGIDLIVGGHSHTFLDREYRDPKNGTLVVQAGQYLFKVGRTELLIDPKSHKVLSSSDDLLSLSSSAGVDPKIQAIVDRHAAAVGKIFDTVVATATAALNRDAEREAELGSWMSDCYRETAKTDLALQNGGGIRAEIPAGPVTLRHLFSVMPFDNALVTLKMTGAQARRVLDHGLKQGRIAQFSGARVVQRRAGGERSLESVEVGGAPLDDAKPYSLVTLDFLVAGGDGYSPFADAAAREDLGILARDALRACAERQKTITPPVPGRLKILDN